MKKTTLVWVHGIGDSLPNYAEPLKKRLFAGFEGSPEARDTEHIPIWYEGVNDQLLSKIRGMDMGLSRVGELLKVGTALPGDLSKGLKDVLGDIFGVWLSQGARSWVFTRMAVQLTGLRQSLLAHGINPKNHNLNLICHSLGTFVTYEFLHWCKDQPGVKVQDLVFKNVFYMAAPIQAIKSLNIPGLTGELAVSRSLDKPWVENAATGKKMTNAQKAWAYRHLHDPVASLFVAKGGFLDAEPLEFSAYHTGALNHDWENHLKEFQEDVLTKIYGALPRRDE